MDETGSGEHTERSGQPKLLMRDPEFEKKNDEAFFALLLDGIGSVKRMDERDKTMKLTQEKRLKEMRQIKVYQKLALADNKKVKGGDLGERVKGQLLNNLSPLTRQVQPLSSNKKTGTEAQLHFRVRNKRVLKEELTFNEMNNADTDRFTLRLIPEVSGLQTDDSFEEEPPA